MLHGRKCCNYCQEKHLNNTWLNITAAITSKNVTDWDGMLDWLWESCHVKKLLQWSSEQDSSAAEQQQKRNGVCTKWRDMHRLKSGLVTRLQLWEGSCLLKTRVSLKRKDGSGNWPTPQQLEQSVGVLTDSLTLGQERLWLRKQYLPWAEWKRVRINVQQCREGRTRNDETEKSSDLQEQLLCPGGSGTMHKGASMSNKSSTSSKWPDAGDTAQQLLYRPRPSLSHWIVTTVPSNTCKPEIHLSVAVWMTWKTYLLQADCLRL